MPPKSKLVFAFVLLVTLTGCSSNSYNRVETGGTQRTDTTLEDSAAVLITMPRDADISGKSVAGSGAAVARLTDASFSRYANIVDVYPSEYRSLGDLKNVISKNNYSYVVVPTIMTWSAQSAVWAHAATQVAVKITVLDAASGKEISSNFFQGEGPSPSSFAATFNTDSDKPDNIYVDLIDDYVDALYGQILPRLIR